MAEIARDDKDLTRPEALGVTDLIAVGAIDDRPECRIVINFCSCGNLR